MKKIRKRKEKVKGERSEEDEDSRKRWHKSLIEEMIIFYH